MASHGRAGLKRLIEQLQSLVDSTPANREDSIASAKEIWWRNHYRHWPADIEIRQFLKVPKSSPPRGGWLKNARLALQKSAASAGSRIGISATGFLKIEERENDGSISLKSLKDAASALDCELVYAIRPLDRRPFSEKTWEQIGPETIRFVDSMMVMPAQATRNIAFWAGLKTQDPKVRKKLGWSKHRRSSSGCS